jgi:hypothetical protein
VARVTAKGIKQWTDSKANELTIPNHKIAFMERQASTSPSSDVYGYQTISHDPVK